MVTVLQQVACALVCQPRRQRRPAHGLIQAAGVLDRQRPVQVTATGLQQQPPSGVIGADRMGQGLDNAQVMGRVFNDHQAQRGRLGPSRRERSFCPTFRFCSGPGRLRLS